MDTGVVVGQLTVITVILLWVGPHTRVSSRSSALEVRLEVARKHWMVASVPAGVGGEPEAGDGGAETLAHVDQVLHLVDPLALTPLVLKPDLNHSLGKTCVFGQFFEYFWRGFWVLVKTVL